MSHTMDHTIPNGLQPHVNGVDSRLSSRDSSPSTRMFPGPGTRAIPANQLPPTKGPINQLINNYANMNINRVATPPQSAQIPQQFNTSTPDSDEVKRISQTFNQSSVMSPISTAGFTHSATSHFSNVNANINTIPETTTPQPQSSPTAQLPSQSAPRPQMPVPSNGPQLTLQNSLPTNAQPPRPALQPSLSQPRLMAYNYPPQQNGPSTNGLPHAPPTSTMPIGNTNQGQTNIANTNQGLINVGNTNQGLINVVNPNQGQTNVMNTNQAQTNFVNSNQGPTTFPTPNQNALRPPMNSQPYQMPPIAPAIRPQMSSPNLFNQNRPPMSGMPPKSNSLSGPDPNISNKAGLHANRYPQQVQQPQPTQATYMSSMPTPPQTSMQQSVYGNMQPHMNTSTPMQQFNTNPVSNQSFPYQQQQKFVPPPTQAQQMQHIPLNSQQQYPQQQQQQIPPHQQGYMQQSQQQQQYMSPVHAGFNRLWGAENFDLLQTPNILPPTKLEAPRISLGNPALDEANCSTDIFRCTMTKIPESNNLLQKSRLPLGILIHPFRDLNHLPVIQCNTIVRCRACRTYINPFVFFVDNKRWKCNLCYRANELPEEFQYDPVTKTYGDPSRRPEVKASTIEYIAPAEYMLRPPQPAVYLFLLDISRAAVESGYLQTVCNTLSSELASLPGDLRTHIGFIAYDSALHFYSLAEGLSQPHEMTVLDIDDVFLPCPDNLLVNLQDRMDLITDLLTQLPNRYNNSYDTGSALGAALQAGHKMMASTGGRITVFQSCLPSVGPGALTSREDPSNRASGEVLHLNPAIDFYKRLALECSGQQIAVDLFILNSQYVDIATISGISRFSGGCMYQFPLFKASRELQNNAFEKSLKRYLTRKIGFEAVMRIRCTRGLTIHTFHGNFFVRSTDLLSLPNINPDAGYGMQVAIEESLSDVQNVCFQAALLYTSSKGERRIRVHTMCLPVVSTLTDVVNSADQQCIVGLLAKMAVDRSMQSSLSDAREAFINVAIDILSSYKLTQNISGNTTLIAPSCLRLLPLYISAMLKHPAFRSGISTRLDDRVKAMCDMKTRPLQYLIQMIYPDLYPVHNLKEQITVLNDEGETVHMPPILQLSARSIDSNGAYLFDICDHMILVVCSAVSPTFLNQVLGVPDYNSITDSMCELPVLDNDHNQRLHMFINYLNEEKPLCATLQIMRENSPLRGAFLERLVEDRVETALSYHEFLQHLKTQVK